MSNNGQRTKKNGKAAAKPVGDAPKAKLIQEELDRERELNVDSMAYLGLSEIAEQLSHIHNSLRSYNVNACNGEMSFTVGLHMGENEDAVRLALEGDAVESIADSLKRIADALSAKQG
jgi:hypothetical protein